MIKKIVHPLTETPVHETDPLPSSSMVIKLGKNSRYTSNSPYACKGWTHKNLCFQIFEF